MLYNYRRVVLLSLDINYSWLFTVVIFITSSYMIYQVNSTYLVLRKKYFQKLNFIVLNKCSVNCQEKYLSKNDKLSTHTFVLQY